MFKNFSKWVNRAIVQPVKSAVGSNAANTQAVAQAATSTPAQPTFDVSAVNEPHEREDC